MRRRGAWTCSSTRTASRPRSPWTRGRPALLPLQRQDRRLDRARRTWPSRCSSASSACSSTPIRRTSSSSASEPASPPPPWRAIPCARSTSWTSSRRASRRPSFFEAVEPPRAGRPARALHRADGRNVLLARPKKYDVIVSDPSDIWVAGVGNLFTREFYEIARARAEAGRRDGAVVAHARARSPST